MLTPTQRCQRRERGRRRAGRWWHVACRAGPVEREAIMLWALAAILIVLWAVGLVTSYTLGGFIHILLVLAIVVLLINVITGRRPVV